MFSKVFLKTKRGGPLLSRSSPLFHSYILFIPLEFRAEQTHVFLRHREKSSRAVSVLRFTGGKIDSAFSRHYRTDKRYMPCHDSNIPFGHAQRKLHRLVIVDITRRCGYPQLIGVHFASPFAFSIASSMLPTKRNADSGRSSCLPSMISAKPRMVSLIGTYLPSIPTNCSATVKG